MCIVTYNISYSQYLDLIPFVEPKQEICPNCWSIIDSNNELLKNRKGCNNCKDDFCPNCLRPITSKNKLYINVCSICSTELF